MTLDMNLYLCLLAVVLRRYKIRGWISKLAWGDAEINVEHGPYCRCDGCKDEPNEMMRWCLIDPATKPEHRPREEPREFQRQTHCQRGHPIEGDNVSLRPGGRACRACTLERSRKYYHQRKQRCTSPTTAQTPHTSRSVSLQEALPTSTPTPNPTQT